MTLHLTKRIGLTTAGATMLALGFLALTPAGAAAQEVITACSVNSSGILYRIDEPGLFQMCRNQHTQFSWTDGEGADHGLLNGLGDDDHPQYVLADGVRGTTNGFAVTGTAGTGAIPASGPGVRIMWYPGKAAFRVGEVTGAAWDDANIGQFSIAMGRNTRASGFSSTAMGTGTQASGLSSTAMGFNTLASETSSTAMGTATVASGNSSTAMGLNTIASGGASTAMGKQASTNLHSGSFIYGDFSTGLITTNVTADNSFVVRAQEIWFGKSGDQTDLGYITTSTGAFLSDGGVWTDASSRAYKENIRELTAEDALAALHRLTPVRFNYKSEAEEDYVGFIAEDVPALVATQDRKGLSPMDVVAVLTKIVQKQDERIAELEAWLDSWQ